MGEMTEAKDQEPNLDRQCQHLKATNGSEIDLNQSAHLQ